MTSTMYILSKGSKRKDQQVRRQRRKRTLIDKEEEEEEENNRGYTVLCKSHASTLCSPHL